jgi:hypothetical protein
MTTFIVTTLTMVGLLCVGISANAQSTRVPWSVFDQGFAVSGLSNTNSSVRSAVGQSFAGPTGIANTWITTGFLFAATVGGGTTPVAENKDGDHPLTYALSQNYPNPFNPATVIRYTIPERTHVVLRVFDILGQEVATLVNQEQASGLYEVRFDAGGLSSGAYFYRLAAGNYVQLRKLLVLK